jgi:non-canonical (house-cleaning) NTP pyrophosphatase
MSEKYVNSAKAAVFSINQWKIEGKERINLPTLVLDSVEFSAKFGAALSKWAEAVDVGKRSMTFSYTTETKENLKMKFTRIA